LENNDIELILATVNCSENFITMSFIGDSGAKPMSYLGYLVVKSEFLK
jgi:hypothetical protein